MRSMIVFVLCFSTAIALQCYSYVSNQPGVEPSLSQMKLVNCNSNACISYSSNRSLLMDGVTYTAGTNYGCSDIFGAEACGTSVRQCIDIAGRYSKCCCKLDKCNGVGAIEDTTKAGYIKNTILAIVSLTVDELEVLIARRLLGQLDEEERVSDSDDDYTNEYSDDSESDSIERVEICTY